MARSFRTLPRRLAVDPERPDSAALQPAVDALAAGEVIAFPTDTLYGLAVDPRRSDAARRLFAAKRRPAGLAVPLIAADIGQIELVARSSHTARPAHGRPLVARSGLDRARRRCRGLTRAWWMRPVLSRSASRRIRWRAVSRSAFNHPITATSANRSGESPATDAAAVVEALGSEVFLVVDGGPTAGGPPSTIVDARGDAPALVREGVVPWDHVLQSLA